MTIHSEQKTVFCSDLTGVAYDTERDANKAEFTHMLKAALRSDSDTVLMDDEYEALAKFFASRYPELWEPTSPGLTANFLLPHVYSRVSNMMEKNQVGMVLEMLFKNFNVIVTTKDK